MDNRQSRCVGLISDDQVGRISRRSGRHSRSGRGWFTVDVFRILTVLVGLGLVLTGKAGAQDTPAKKAETPRESAPTEGTSEALSVRYRFIEKYSVEEKPDQPELISQCQVALLGTLKTVSDTPQGAPDQFETSLQLIYTERPAKVSKIGEVIDVVRHYDKYLKKTSKPTRAPKLPYFEGMTIWYHRRPGQDPEIESLDDRRIRELEYDQITKQVFLPQITAIFLPTPIRVGDTWHITPSAARNLVSETPDPQGYTLEGTLIEVHKGSSATLLTAVIGISGQFTLGDRECAVNSRIHFIFEPKTISPAGGTGTSPRSTDGGAKPIEKIVEARGWVSRLLMTQTAAYPVPGSDNRLRETTTFELNLERRRQQTTPNAAGAAKYAPLPIPGTTPTADEANSWLTYDDGLGQFHFRHPQDLRVVPRVMDANVVELVGGPSGGSTLALQFVPKPADPKRELQYRDPDYHRRGVYSLWEEQHWDVVKGPTGWLPEADWLPLKRKVYRIEAATKPPDSAANARRTYRDYYLVLFDTNQTMVVWAITEEDHLKFRDQSEAVIKSFQFGPSDEQPKSPSATQTPAPTPPARPETTPAGAPTPAPKPPF